MFLWKLHHSPRLLYPLSNYSGIHSNGWHKILFSSMSTEFKSFQRIPNNLSLNKQTNKQNPFDCQIVCGVFVSAFCLFSPQQLLFKIFKVRRQKPNITCLKMRQMYLSNLHILRERSLCSKLQNFFCLQKF